MRQQPRMMRQKSRMLRQNDSSHFFHVWRFTSYELRRIQIWKAWRLMTV